MLQQERLICFRRQHLACDQAALFCPAPGQVRLQEAETLRRVEGVDRPQDLIAMDLQRPCWIAKRRNLLATCPGSWLVLCDLCLATGG